ncbi:MAG: phytanoyl-CoA dioxygenase family protein [Pseudomonadota bacterium]
MIEVTDSMRERFANDGAIKVERFLSAQELGECRRCFDFNLANPGPTALPIFAGTEHQHYNDLGTAKSQAYYEPMLKGLGFADFLAELWGSEHVWYFGEEIFIKAGGKVGRSPWHQDTPYFTAEGSHLANIWISFEALPVRNCLEVVKGSHNGTKYDGAAYEDPANPTRPLWGDEYYPRLPDIEAERAADPRSWDVLSWELALGDAVILHSGALHGGAPVDEVCSERHTLVLRFFGDEVRYAPFPDTKPDYFMDLRQFDVPGLRPGEAFRCDEFLQLK